MIRRAFRAANRRAGPASDLAGRNRPRQRVAGWRPAVSFAGGPVDVALIGDAAWEVGLVRVVTAGENAVEGVIDAHQA